MSKHIDRREAARRRERAGGNRQRASIPVLNAKSKAEMRAELQELLRTPAVAEALRGDGQST
jgi:hypothetical protein